MTPFVIILIAPNAIAERHVPVYTFLTSLRVIVERNTDQSPMMTIILPNNLFTMQLPKASVVIRASCNQVRGISTECAIPDPALVTGQSTLELEGLGVFLSGWCLAWYRDHGFEVLDFPDLGCVVGGAGCEVLDVGRE